jgi:hypothetical protein
MKHTDLINRIIKECLVFDIETCSFYPDSKQPIDIRKDFKNYVKYAKTKWIGFYSYKYGEYWETAVNSENKSFILKYFSDHKTYVGFNNRDFDSPICVSNEIMSDEYTQQLDLMRILGKDQFRGFKNRGEFMKLKLKKIVIDGKKYGAHSLQGIASAMGLPFHKGDIDYKIFYKDEWTDEECDEIKKYLRMDIELTKQIFEKTMNFWMLVTDWLSEKDIENWSWIGSSMASLTYKDACNAIGVEDTYGEKGEKTKMGGRAIDPPESEVWNLWYLDEKSKYPHTFAEFDLFNEINVDIFCAEARRDFDCGELTNQEILNFAVEQGLLFHGNDLIKVRGYYDMRKRSILSMHVLTRLRTRFDIQKVLKNIDSDLKLTIEIPETLTGILESNQLTKEIIDKLKGLEYMIKILLNALYGVARSAVFEKLYTPNAGYDCCWIGQQTHEFIEKEFNARGYLAKGGFTDSWFFKRIAGDSEESIKALCAEIMVKLQKYMPYPAETHKIGLECCMDYVMFHAKEKKAEDEEDEDEYNKNNYCYITTKNNEKEVKIVGFPIKKSNSSKLGPMIYEKHLEPKIKAECRAKFDKNWVHGLVDSELRVEDAVIDYDTKPAESYKERVTKDGVNVESSNIYAQISRVYTDGNGGMVGLIKNKKAGKLGPGAKKKEARQPIKKNDWFYGTLQECIDAGVTVADVNKDKILNELAPFVLEEK